MLRYMMKLFDADTGVLLLERQYRRRRDAIAMAEHYQQPGTCVRAIVLDLLSDGLSKKIVYSR